MARPSDIIVIGAGVIGCAVAHELARRGASVEIVDDRPVGMGATQASAGVLAPYIEAREGSPLLELTTVSLGMYDEFVARVASDSGVAIPYRRTGTLDIATTDTDLHKLQETADVLARRRIAAVVLDAQGVREHEPQIGAGAIGGLLIETHGYVGAADLTRALAAAARRCGARLIEQSRVRRVVAQGSDLVVETDLGSLPGSAVVVAAGSWSGDVTLEGLTASVPVRPVRGQLLVLAWPGTPLRRVTWSSRCYMVPWEDGTLLVGATSEEAGFDERTTVAGVRDLLDAVCEVVPHAWSAGFRTARVGLRPATPDGLPVIGRSTALPNVIYATGHYRNGILLAPLTAKLIAGAWLDGRVDPMMAAGEPARFGRL